jgi:hypothetical protein
MAEATPETRDAKNIKLNRGAVISLFLYYLILLLAAGAYAMKLNLTQKTAPGEEDPFFLCLALSVVGVSIFYIRKLYKACISDNYTFTQESLSAKMIGSIAYFAARPFFGFFFAWVSYMIWVTTIISSVKEFTGFSPNHFYLSGLLGFFVGFLVGRVVSKLENSGEKHLMGVV